MKKLNEKVEKENEKMGSMDGILALIRALEEMESEEKKEVLFSEGVDNRGEFLERGLPDYRGGLRNNTRKWDSGKNYDSFFGNGEEQKGLSLDLNIPEGASSIENRAEIIDIASDDSDVEMEVVGCDVHTKGRSKGIEIGMPSDRTGRLEMGLQINYPINKANEDVEVGVPRTWIPEPLPVKPHVPVRPQVAAQAVRQPEPVIIRHIDDYEHQHLRKAAKRFARSEDPSENSGAKPTCQTQREVNVKAVEKLGNPSGLFAEALRRVIGRTSKRAAEELIEWEPSIKNGDCSITATFVPSLLELSLKALAKNADSIVSLELVPYFLRKKLIDLLCDSRKMNTYNFNLLVKGCPTEIRIKNCSWLTEQQFQQSLGSCQTENLRVLQLDLCGQCMLDVAFRVTLARSLNSFSSLAIVSLRGACCLTDEGLKLLVMSAPRLLSINLGHCSLLTCDATNAIADSLGSTLRELYIDDCQKINAMLILPAAKKLKKLEVFSVAGVRDVSDQFISQIVTVCGQSIKELDLADCLELTDLSLKAIGSCCAGLCSLNISNLDKLTDLGIECLANGCRSIQRLKLMRTKFSDEATAAFLETSGQSLLELTLNNMAKVGPHTAVSLAQHARKLLYLDVSFCRRISNNALGLIVDSCLSLKLLKVFGCKQPWPY